MKPSGGKRAATRGEQSASSSSSSLSALEQLTARPSRKIALLLIATLLLAVPIIINAFMITSNPTAHSKELASRFLLAAIAVAAIAAAPRFSRAPLQLTEAAALLFIAACFLSALFSGRFAFGFFQNWHLWGFVGLAVLIPRLQPGRRELRAFVFVVLTAGVLCVLYGFARYLGRDPLHALYPFEQTTEGRNFMISFLGNAEYFGEYMTPIAVLALSRALRPGMPITRGAVWLLLALVFLLTVGLTGSRGAVIGFAAGASVVAFFQSRLLPKRARRQMFAAAGIAAAGLFLAVLVLSTPNRLNARNMRLAQRFVEAADLNSSSVRERILLYVLSSRMVAEDPLFGSGPATFQLRFFPALDKLIQEDPRAGTTIFAQDLAGRMGTQVHCDYLQIWVEAGSLGLASLLLLIAAALTRFIRGRPAVAKGAITRSVADLACLRAGFFGAATCIFVNALFSFPLQLPARASLAWCCIGLFLAADNLLQQKRLQITATPGDENA